MNGAATGGPAYRVIGTFRRRAGRLAGILCKGCAVKWRIDVARGMETGWALDDVGMDGRRTRGAETGESRRAVLYVLCTDLDLCLAISETKTMVSADDVG